MLFCGSVRKLGALAGALVTGGMDWRTICRFSRWLSARPLSDRLFCERFGEVVAIGAGLLTGACTIGKGVGVGCGVEVAPRALNTDPR